MPADNLMWKSCTGLNTNSDIIKVSIMDGHEVYAEYNANLAELFGKPGCHMKYSWKFKTPGGGTGGKLLVTLLHMPGLNVAEQSSQDRAAPLLSDDEFSEFSDD